MAYVDPNFKTKKELLEALTSGKNVNVYLPGLGSIPANGKIYLEGPHYPQPHRWYALGIMANGKLTSIK